MKVRRLSTAQSVAEVLRAQITSGELPPLMRLVEAELAVQLSVSRTPLREALQQLEAEGFVERMPGGGLKVTDVHPEDVSELFWLRAVLERAVVQEVTRTVTPAQLDGLEQVIMQMDLLREYPEQFLALGRDFHRGLADLLGNQRCSAVLDHVRSHVDRYWAATTSHRPERIGYASNHHREILSLMRQGAAEEAGSRMSQHIMAEAEVCLETVREIRARTVGPLEVVG